ncbi:exocyst complex component 1 [Amia ocellicauda]|uniref:exocyst complex component 1 n=1 Tax=Amia ocellicauda TaxID=2972642 RepID=UPI003464D964|nr:EXOC1 protein [Amia calva]
MAVFSLRSILQREIFTPREERLLGVSFVWKASRKSKSAILCAAVSSELPVQVVLVTVKAVRGHYKLSEHWQAAELTLVDGKDVVKETAEFHLHLDKVYKWVSSSVGEKMTFVTCLWKINQRYLQDRVKFINISPAILEEMLPWEQGGAPEEREMMEKEEGYQELTAREADNIDRLMKQSELLVADAKAFTQLLLMELQALDQENLLSLMAVEQRVGSLEELLEQGLAEVELLELAVAEQDGLLRSVQRQMEHLHMRSTWLQRIDRNHSLLESELAYLVDNLTLSENDMQILSEGDLGQPVQVEACSAAVQALTRCAGTPLTPGQRRLQGVAEQLIRFESLRQSFEQRCIMHINSAIIAQAMGNGATLEGRDGLVLPRPTGRHAQLLQYTPLMRWLRETSPATCQHLQKGLKMKDTY